MGSGPPRQGHGLSSLSQDGGLRLGLAELASGGAWTCSVPILRAGWVLAWVGLGVETADPGPTSARHSLSSQPWFPHCGPGRLQFSCRDNSAFLSLGVRNSDGSPPCAPPAPRRTRRSSARGKVAACPPTTRAMFPGLCTASRSPSPPRCWAPCCPRGPQGEGSAWGRPGLRDPGGRAGFTCSQHPGVDAALLILPCRPPRSPFRELENRCAEVKWLVWAQRSAAQLGLEPPLSVALCQLQRGQQQSGREWARVAAGRGLCSADPEASLGLRPVSQGTARSEDTLVWWEPGSYAGFSSRGVRAEPAKRKVRSSFPPSTAHVLGCRGPCTCLYFLPAVREPQFDRWLGEVTWKRERVLLTTSPLGRFILHIWER